jgi:pericentriolar material 1 protein
MVQIIPIVKQQMNGICSQQLLHYIQQLTLSLTRLQQLHQPPHSMISASNHTNEFARFFYRQLDTILRDSFAKFEGRK